MLSFHLTCTTDKWVLHVWCYSLPTRQM